ncbi:site-specific integrase [Sulfurimonas sp. SAG-AH-194-I05]|nr:site-specific integrase [Sulfurimonas sp. SAG-AH-194-I05]MDF1876067.1 site-specific integrase [Sulfurimonas sp. SAG-AH-194-I05]
MINIESILNKGLKANSISIDTGKGILGDLEFWGGKFMHHVNNSKHSDNTLRSYGFIIRTLIEYFRDIIALKDTIDKISAINATIINGYLSYLENYAVNKEYGSIEKRISILFRYTEDIVKCKDIKAFTELPLVLSERYTIDEAEVFEYMIKEFALYMQNENLSPKEINNHSIQNYIVNVSTLSATTMQQRKASLQSFLSYIDKSTQKDFFKQFYWEMKSYKTTKKNNKVHKGAFDEKLLEKLIFILKDYPFNINTYKQKVYANSEFSACKNTLLILIMLHGGARASEATHIRYEDIQEIVRDDGKRLYKIEVLGKGDKSRYIYILKEHIHKHIELLHTLKGSNPYISGKKNTLTPLRTQSLYLFAEYIFLLLGEKKSGLHIFRHHFASSFAEKNGNIKLLQDMLGHSNITTTMIYSDVREVAKIDAV